MHEAGPDGGAEGDVGVGVHEGEVWGAFGGSAMSAVKGLGSALTVGQVSRLDGCVIRSWSLEFHSGSCTAADGEYTTLRVANASAPPAAPAVTITSDAGLYVHTHRWHVAGTMFIRAGIVTHGWFRACPPPGGKRARRARVCRVGR